MAVSLDTKRINLVFQSRPDILGGIQKAADTPARVTLFNEIASFVLDLTNGRSDEPASKRRRLDNEQSNGHQEARAQGAGTGGGAITGKGSLETAAAAEAVLLEIKDISLSIPQRKKYDLCFTKNYLYARAPGASVPVQGIVYAWRDIEYLFYLPVPEKTQLQYNYVLFPRSTYLPSKTAPAADIEPLVFTVPSTAPKPNTIAGPSASNAAAVSDTYSALFHWVMTTSLRSAGNTATQLVASDPKVFQSVVRQAHRPSEPAVHVKAFRGSKDGYLFFLPTGILWGFKKPLLFMPLDRIVAVSYTSVLQRTFNMVVEVEGIGEAGGSEEIEFAMLDQEDYAGIDQTYVRRHGLQDRSMAEQRKAKRELVENLKKSKEAGEVNGEAGGDDGMTELEKAGMEAEQQLQDDEDENEEDYDPGSEGESDGEGSSSEENDDDEDGEEEDDEDGGEYDEEDDEEGYEAEE